MTQSKSRQKQSYFLAFFLLIFFLSLDIQVFANCEQLQEKIVRKIGLEADPSASLEGISISQASNKDRVALNKFIKNQRKLVGIDQPLLEGKSNLDSDLLDIKTNFPKKAAEFLIIKNKFGEILGTGAFSRKSIRKMNGKTEEVYYSGFTAEIKKLYLDPRLQGKGIGKDFIEHLIEEAQKKGYESIELETFETWESALKLYKKLGFQEYERFQNLNEPVSIRMLLAFEKKWPTHVFQNSQAKLEFVKSVQKALENNRERFKKILTQVDTASGAEYELNQALDTLKGIEKLELDHLQNTKVLENVAVYGSTNIPLYSLILHAIIPANIAKNVWFRTPEASRHVYLKLFEELENILGKDVLAGIHLLTDLSDVQYDNFRKKYVLGMHHKGTRFERRPSEVVLFTGSPETGKRIREANFNKLLEKNAGIPEFKQVFLQFGAGMNPMIVTSEAKERINDVTSAILDSIKINCGQDCIAPNFYAIHEKVTGEIVGDLLKNIRTMKFGKTSDELADYSPLTFTRDFSKLKSYRNRYEALGYLKNPDALIDSDKRLVSPHVFVFPVSKFSEVNLQEHYGPFITIFVYDNEKDLNKIAIDRRVQNKAMYASIFGGKSAGPETTAAQTEFAQQRHGTSLNKSIYSAESGNMPFGGSGKDASVVAILEKNKSGAITKNIAHYPILFSEEARKAFGTKVKLEEKNLRSREYYQSQLKDFLKVVLDAKYDGRDLGYDWHHFLNPNRDLSPDYGLKPMQKAAQNKIYQVILEPNPLKNSQFGSDFERHEALAKLKDFYGTELIFADDFQKVEKGEVPKGKGLVLHPTMPDEGPKRLNVYRGDSNPHLAVGYLHPLLDNNKLKEYQMAEAIWPGIMERSETFADLKANGKISALVLQKRNEIIENVRSFLTHKNNLGELERIKLKKDITEMLGLYFEDIRQIFPEGAFIKNYDDFATADLGIQITSFGSNPVDIAEQFVRRLETAKNKFYEVHPSQLAAIDHPNFKMKLLQENYETGSKFLYYFLQKPDDLLAQRRVTLARTELGAIREYRVDFLDGQAVFSKLRFSHEYMPSEALEAKKIIDDFFRRAPLELKHSCGGADVARTNDGRWLIIEFNFGSSSGTLMPKYFPLDSHQIIKALQGKNTILLDKLEKVQKSGIEAQKVYLEHIKQVTEVWEKKSLDDLSRAEVARWFRDRNLEDWSKGSDPSQAKKLIEDLKYLLNMSDSGTGELKITTEEKDIEEYYRQLILGAENYIEKKLGFAI